MPSRKAQKRRCDQMLRKWQRPAAAVGGRVHAVALKAQVKVLPISPGRRRSASAWRPKRAIARMKRVLPLLPLGRRKVTAASSRSEPGTEVAGGTSPRSPSRIAPRTSFVGVSQLSTAGARRARLWRCPSDGESRRPHRSPRRRRVGRPEPVLGLDARRPPWGTAALQFLSFSQPPLQPQGSGRRRRMSCSQS
jgi:hypothetical protein